MPVVCCCHFDFGYVQEDLYKLHRDNDCYVGMRGFIVYCCYLGHQCVLHNKEIAFSFACCPAPLLWYTITTTVFSQLLVVADQKIIASIGTFLYFDEMHLCGRRDQYVLDINRRKTPKNKYIVTCYLSLDRYQI